MPNECAAIQLNALEKDLKQLAKLASYLKHLISRGFLVFASSPVMTSQSAKGTRPVLCLCFAPC